MVIPSFSYQVLKTLAGHELLILFILQMTVTFQPCFLQVSDPRAITPQFKIHSKNVATETMIQIQTM